MAETREIPQALPAMVEMVRNRPTDPRSHDQWAGAIPSQGEHSSIVGYGAIVLLKSGILPQADVEKSGVGDGAEGALGNDSVLEIVDHPTLQSLTVLLADIGAVLGDRGRCPVAGEVIGQLLLTAKMLAQEGGGIGLEHIAVFGARKPGAKAFIFETPAIMGGLGRRRAWPS